MLTGYAWLAVAGLSWLLAGPVTEGPRYDATIHAVFLGFVISMIMAHAPVILPAVLGRDLLYRPVLWLPLGLLHAGLALRFAGALGGWDAGWRAGGVVTVLALLVFVVTAVTLVVRR